MVVIYLESVITIHHCISNNYASYSHFNKCIKKHKPESECCSYTVGMILNHLVAIMAMIFNIKNLNDLMKLYKFVEGTLEIWNVKCFSRPKILTKINQFDGWIGDLKEKRLKNIFYRDGTSKVAWTETLQTFRKEMYPICSVLLRRISNILYITDWT